MSVRRSMGDSHPPFAAGADCNAATTIAAPPERSAANARQVATRLSCRMDYRAGKMAPRRRGRR
jgi:hypothetical protein